MLPLFSFERLCIRTERIGSNGGHRIISDKRWNQNLSLITLIAQQPDTSRKSLLILPELFRLIGIEGIGEEQIHLRLKFSLLFFLPLSRCELRLLIIQQHSGEFWFSSNTLKQLVQLCQGDHFFPNHQPQQFWCLKNDIAEVFEVLLDIFEIDFPMTGSQFFTSGNLPGKSAYRRASLGLRQFGRRHLR